MTVGELKKKLRGIDNSIPVYRFYDLNETIEKEGFYVKLVRGYIVPDKSCTEEHLLKVYTLLYEEYGELMEPELPF